MHVDLWGILYLIGVSRGHSNSFQRVSRRTRSANILYSYWIDENFKFSKKKITKFEYFISKYFKTKYKKRKFLCESCNNIFFGIVKEQKTDIDCPYCE